MMVNTFVAKSEESDIEYERKKSRVIPRFFLRNSKNKVVID